MCIRDSEYLQNSFDKARSENYILGAKIVRGAYMEKERNRAKEKGYQDPIQIDKLSTDCLLYTSPSPRDRTRSRMPSSAWKKKKKQQNI